MKKYSIPDISRGSPLVLRNSLRIGRGNKRDCYVHPDDAGQCIKVPRHPTRQDECQEQSIVEWHYINHLKQRCVPLAHVIDCHGWVYTSQGVGLVMERVQDDDGAPALTLRDALIQRRISRGQIERMLAILKDWAIAHAIVIADLNTDNLMIRSGETESVFVLVDGFGSRRPDWKFSLYQKLPSLSRWKTKRQWKRQEVTLFKTVDEILADRCVNRHSPDDVSTPALIRSEP
ncbi:YrbL family protein [Halomonas sp. YLGW01]|uniref:YrbL family protein n=1 Tax=Halomonas sp. YLGW01 TaxID=2773308 RepID=UPI0017848F63|nr:YrbL family protein [Halomonas sp. YLGW01]